MSFEFCLVVTIYFGIKALLNVFYIGLFQADGDGDNVVLSGIRALIFGSILVWGVVQLLRF